MLLPIQYSKGHGQKTKNRHWFLFFSLSILVHIGLLNEITIQQPTINDETHEVGVITIRLIAPKPDIANRFEQQANAKTKPAERPSPNSARTIDDHPGKKAILQSSIKSKSSSGLNAPLVRAWDAIPALIDELESNQNEGDKAFNTHKESYRQIETSKRETHVERSRPNSPIEITGVYSDSMGVRIGDNCWLAPIENISEQFDSRIWMKELNCPKRKKINFAADP